MKQTGQTATSKNWARSEIRCNVLRPDQISRAQADIIFARPPAAGKISLAEYEDRTRNTFGEANTHFAGIVTLAATVDPAQIKANLATFGDSSVMIRALRSAVPGLQRLLKTNPQLTVEEAFEASSQMVRVNPMSPSSIVGFELMPLVMADTP